MRISRDAVLAERRSGGSRPSTATLPAPVKGWNARDSLQDMDPADAIQLRNWQPDSDAVRVRAGYTLHYAHGGGTTETLAEFKGNDGTKKLIAAYDNKLAEVSNASSPTTLETGMSNARWQHVNFNDRLFLANGADTMQVYNGTATADSTFTGVTQSTIINVHAHKSRMYLVPVNSAAFWYGGTGSISGSVSSFDLGQIAPRGGILMACGSWSRDAGDGMDDLFVAVMSSGDILVYSGSNPGDATNWALVGTYAAGEPLGRRCLVKVGGDLVVLTRAGYVPVSMLLEGGTADTIEHHPIWGKIRPAVRDAAGLYASNFGWQGFQCPSGCAVYFNVPENPGSAYKQHWLNTLTGAWAEWTIPAACWGSYDGSTYFGTFPAGGAYWNEATWNNAEWADGGRIMKLGGANDAGIAITATARCAYSYLGSRQRTKKVTGLRPKIATDGTLAARIGVNVDFSDRNLGLSPTVQFAASTGAQWDSATWDSATWGETDNLKSQWVTVNGIGRAMSRYLETTTSAQAVTWYADDVLFTPGGAM